MGEASQTQKVSQWSKDVKKALIDKDMTLRKLAEDIGYGITTVSMVIRGRYSNMTAKVIVEKINEVLGTTGMPERTDTPSDEWCQQVRIELIKRKMSINQLAEELDVSRDKLSMILNGRMMNEELVNLINELLDIKMPAIPSGDD